MSAEGFLRMWPSVSTRAVTKMQIPESHLRSHSARCETSPRGSFQEGGSGLALRSGPSGHRGQHGPPGVQAAEAEAWRAGSGRGGRTHVTETDVSYWVISLLSSSFSVFLYKFNLNSK